MHIVYILYKHNLILPAYLQNLTPFIFSTIPATEWDST